MALRFALECGADIYEVWTLSESRQWCNHQCRVGKMDEISLCAESCESCFKHKGVSRQVGCQKSLDTHSQNTNARHGEAKVVGRKVSVCYRMTNRQRDRQTCKTWGPGTGPSQQSFRDQPTCDDHPNMLCMRHMQYSGFQDLNVKADWATILH